MCCFLGICEAIGVVLTTLVLSTLSGYAMKAIYLASLEHRNPELWDAFNEKFWAPTGTVFWVTFFAVALVLVVVWFLLHQLCNCCSVCRQHESASAPAWWRRMQRDTEATPAEIEAYERLNEEDDMRQQTPSRRNVQNAPTIDIELERYKQGN